MADPMKMDEPSADHKAMAPYWERTNDVMGGIHAMRAGRDKYLPSFKTEDRSQFDYRLKMTKMTNVFAESVSTLAAKPFREPIILKGTPPESLLELQHDIDGRGNNLTIFAAQVFRQGATHGIHWILIDSPPAPTVMSQAEARNRNIRPYWVSVRAENMLEVRTQRVYGKEEISYARILEPGDPKRVRVFTRTFGEGGSTTWELFEERDDPDRRGTKVWVRIDGGEMGINRIPLVPFITGEREGDTWQIVPPLRDAVDLQIELYQSESALKFIANVAGYPMLAGNGIQPEKDAAGSVQPVAVGPTAVLYAPPRSSDGNHGEWRFIEPSGESMRFLLQICSETEVSMREMMRQPLTVNSENLTVITTAVAAGKTRTLLGAWRLLLIDALENCMKITLEWMGQAASYDPDVFVFADIDEFLESKDVPELIQLRTTGIISQRTVWRELVRRGVLASDFDADAEEQALLAEVPADIEDETDALEDQQ